RALVPTVVPWEKNEKSAAATPSSINSRTPLSTAWKGSLGVEGTLAIRISLVCSLKKTKSEKVPPVSTETLYLGIDFPGVDFLTLTPYTINFARQQSVWNRKKDSSPAVRSGLSSSRTK